MAPKEHTLGASCRLKPIPQISYDDDMPQIKAQFFYSSLIPIDDPLSAGSAIGGAPDQKSARRLLRPFSYGDNNLLEKTWLTLMSEDDRRQHEDAKHQREPGSASATTYNKRRERIVQALSHKHWDKHRAGSQTPRISIPSTTQEPQPTHVPLCCPEVTTDVFEALRTAFCALARKTNPALSVDQVTQDVIAAIDRRRRSVGSLENIQTGSMQRVSSTRSRGNTASSTPPTPSHFKRIPHGGANSLRSKRSRDLITGPHTGEETDFEPSSLSVSGGTKTPTGLRGLSRSLANDDGLTGKPFIRVESTEHLRNLSSSLTSRQEIHETEGLKVETDSRLETLQDEEMDPVKQAEPTSQELGVKEAEDVVVGVARLHMVSLPMLQMKPIYWSPVNDVAAVTRGTWFYRDSMEPVQPDVANQLEAGFHELKPWTETWRDEIRCAIDVGAAGEEKVSHQLWPNQDLPPSIKRVSTEPRLSSDPFCSAHCFRGEASAEGSIEPPRVGDEDFDEAPRRPYASYHVIYKDHREAFLLKPSLRPSAYYNNKPVLRIMKGHTVGIPVVRGFDRETWERIHLKGQSPAGIATSAQKVATGGEPQESCPACKAEREKGQVTDLMLVAHGIGQKIAERVESYHFTHAINGFRRAMNTELRSPTVQQVLRDDHIGLMVLPLNWRVGLSFDDGGPMGENDASESDGPEPFSLKDIEPNTIPAIRSMISDVMFDIPFYMSHHKPKMIKSLITEANRVYRLWCRNNPGFAEKGRVHLMAHSLGSAMAIEILSRQPTRVPRINLSLPEPDTRFFEFDTNNLFLMGSPAGFFMLLERGALLPRHGRMKPGADSNDIMAKGVVGEAGTFGCLSVDNIYNILAKEDPIAYLLTGAVDPTYAASLKTAYVPTTSVSIFESVGNAVRTVVPGMSPRANPLMVEPERPSTVRLPSQLELEVHDFTREEIAEKKAFLLNDNGQIDWFLRSGGGPLEIQYLNMLSAHTCYWTNSDFIRMLCMEIGRKPGRDNTIPAMRAVKAAKRRIPGVH